MHIDFTTIIDYIGTFAFAISGIRLASAKRFDWFGAYVVGAATAIGGGTTRDLMPVSYTHLDVYKRQVLTRSGSCFQIARTSRKPIWPPC